VLSAHIPEVSSLPIAFQVGLVRVQRHIDIYNQDVEWVRTNVARTFDSSLSTENREHIIRDLDATYLFIANRARMVCDAIAAIPTK